MLVLYTSMLVLYTSKTIILLQYRAHQQFVWHNLYRILSAFCVNPMPKIYKGFQNLSQATKFYETYKRNQSMTTHWVPKQPRINQSTTHTDCKYTTAFKFMPKIFGVTHMECRLEWNAPWQHYPGYRVILM